MRIRSLQIHENAGSRPFSLSLGRTESTDSNFFSILVGPNGTRKSQSLRDIVDLAFSSITRVRDPGLRISSKAGALVFRRQTSGRSESPLPSQILAVSGVATDRFPAQLTARKKDADLTKNPYRYIGPKTENIISRSLGIRQLAESILLHADRVRSRRKQLRAAFELLPISHGILFTFEARPPESGAWSPVKMKRYLISQKVPLSPRDFLSLDATIKELYALVTWNAKVELRFDLDDEDSISMTPQVSYATLNLALRTGLLSVGNTYALAKNDRTFPLLEFSSGQWHILSTLLFVALASSDDTLIVADELENSLHPEWQREYLRLFSLAISGNNGIHAIVATHSPFVASSLPPEQAEVLQLSRSRLGNLSASAFPRGPFGWTADEILEGVFGLGSTRSRIFSTKVDRALELFGKGDRKNQELQAIVEGLVCRLDDLPPDDIAANIIRTIATAIAN